MADVRSRWRSLPLLVRAATGIGAGLCVSLLWYGRRRSSRKKTVVTDSAAINTAGRGQFAGKTVLITGAAGDIGGAAAEAFAKRGAKLVLVDLPSTAGRLLERRSELETSGAAGVHVIPADVTQQEDVKVMVEEAVKLCGRVDCCFNNAGIQGELLPVHKQSPAVFQKTIDVNVMGVFLGMKYVSSAMIRAGGGGVIVNTASLAGLEGPASMAAYAASKFAVVGMTKSAAKDLGPHGIRVCAIAPGLLEGKMWTSQVRGKALCRRAEGDGSELSEEEIKETEQRLLAGTPLSRLGRLSEVANVVAFLCSEEASYISGATISIDGARVH